MVGEVKCRMTKYWRMATIHSCRGGSTSVRQPFNTATMKTQISHTENAEDTEIRKDNAEAKMPHAKDAEDAKKES